MPKQNGNHFQMTFSNTFSWVKTRILIRISLKYVPNGPINNDGILYRRMYVSLSLDKLIGGEIFK